MPFLNDQLSFLDLFNPPVGYETKFVELTTFSISLGFATLIPTLIYAGNNELISPDMNLKAIMKREGFQDVLTKFHIFYDGKLKMDVDAFAEFQKGITQFGSYILNKNAHGITKSSGLFHPKIMVFEFVNKNDPFQSQFRVFIGSRNLTYSNYVEAGVCLDIKCEEKSIDDGIKADKIGETLEAFFEEYYKPECNTNINWENLKGGNIYINGSIPSVISIHFLNLESSIKKDLNDCVKARIVSMNPNTDLFNFIPDKITYVANYNDIFDDKGDKKLLNVEMAYLKYSKDKNDLPTKALPLHAKIYAIAKEKEFITWIGSANCSENGLKGTNVEVMLRIVSSCNQGDTFPITELNGKSLFLGNQKNGITYCCDEVAEAEEVLDEESLMVLPVTIEGKYENKEFELKITYKNNTPELKITPLGFGSASTKLVNKNCSIKFPMCQENFTNIFQVMCEGDIYRIIINIDNWYGVDVPIIIGSIELDKMNSLKELVPACRAMYSPNQDAYERILAHKSKDTPEEFKKFLNNVLCNIEVRKNDKNSESVLQILEKAIEQLEKLCEQLLLL